MALVDIKVPDIGDFAEVGVIELLVKPGDTVKAEQSLITVESDKASMEIPSSHAGVIKELKAALGDKVKEVRVTHRLTDSPACLVADEHEMGMNLARLMKAAGQNMPISRPILEINPTHPVVLRLKYEDKQFEDWAAVLFDQALLAEGGTLDDPASFVKRINQLMLAMNAS